MTAVGDSWTFEEIIEALRPFAEGAVAYEREWGALEVPDHPMFIDTECLKRARTIFLKLGGRLDE